ncbi:MAG: hypothetical protein K0Q73_6122 [Paenibacillus sp.]|jgi:beta-phosphoglucomutase-like phosphatase (HAD superfamily)|nr:hypothetical protein [Paenibacillus sp.]
MIEAVVFDFDGLIIDTESAWYEALAGLFEEQGAALPLEKWTLCVGGESRRVRPVTIFGGHAAEAHRSGRFKSRSGRPAFGHYGKEDNSSRRRIVFAGRQGAGADNRPRFQLAQKLGGRLLAAVRAVALFSCIKTADDVAKVKPDPELYLRATAGLGVSPAAAVAFEDSPNGARAATAAGLACVIVTNAGTGTLTFDRYALRLNSMADMKLAEVLASIRR